MVDYDAKEAPAFKAFGMKVLKQSEVNNLIQLHQSGQFALAEEKAKNFNLIHINQLFFR